MYRLLNKDYFGKRKDHKLPGAFLGFGDRGGGGRAVVRGP